MFRWLTTIIVAFLSTAFLTADSSGVGSTQEKLDVQLERLQIFESLCAQAESFTVQLLNDDKWGSGVIVNKHGSVYTIVTNDHVLPDQPIDYVDIETYDGVTYRAAVVSRLGHGPQTGNDLAFLQFRSPESYEVAELSGWQSDNIPVIAAGIPQVLPEPENENLYENGMSLSLSDQFFCTSVASTSYRLDRSMQQGYRLGVPIGIHVGMSGGPLISQEGYVIGINGKSIPLLVGSDSYLYRNGESVVETLEPPDAQEDPLDFVSRHSWFIPSETVVYYAPSGLGVSISDVQ